MKSLRILNTRPKNQARTLTDTLTQWGATVIECPMLEIQATEDWLSPPLALSDYHHAIFISPNAVSYFFNKVSKQTWPGALHTITIGAGTARTLATHEIKTHEIANPSNSEGLLALSCLQHIKNKKVLLIKGMGGLSLIENTLIARGAQITTLSVYQRIQPKVDLNLIHDLWQRDALDMIFISSQEALSHLFTLFGEEKWEWLCNKPFLVISQRLAKAAENYGVKTILINKEVALLT